MYATYPVLVPNAAIKPLVVDTHKNLWVFADKNHPPSPWLLLFRESTNDDDFETLTDHSLLFGYQHQTETLLQQLYRHFRIGQSETLPSHGHTTETDRVIKNLFTGQLRMFKVDPKYKHSLLDNQSLFWTQPQNLGDGQGEDSLQLRHNIINELGATLMARWMRTDAGNTTFEDYGFWGKRAIEYIALIHGVSDGISSVAQGLWDMIKAFGHAIKVSVEWVGSAVITSYQFIESQISEADLSVIATKSQQLLGDTISSVKQLGKRIAEGFEIFKAALTDPYVGDAFMQYMDGYTESASHVDRIHAVGNIAGQVITEIVLLLALAPVQLAKLASQGVMMVGRISLKVIEMLSRFGRLRRARLKNGVDALPEPPKPVPELKVRDTSKNEKVQSKSDDQDKKPKQTKQPTPEEIKLAKSEGSSLKHIAARKKVARHYLENNGFETYQIENALGSKDGKINPGIDIMKPVEVISYPPPDYMSQYVKSHGYPGNWFDPIGEQSANSLGISSEGRKLKLFKMPKDTGLRSYAKPVLDDWTNPDNPVMTEGGGVQLLVNDAVKKACIGM